MLWKPLRLIPIKTDYDFLGKRIPALVLSTGINIASLILVFTVGFNFGIDFLGGIAVEARSTKGPADLAAIRTSTASLGVGEVSLQEFGNNETVLVRVQRQDPGPTCVANAGKVLSAALGAGWSMKPATGGLGGEIEVTAPQPFNDERRVAVARAIGVNDAQVARGAGPTTRVTMTPEQQAEWCQQVAIRLVSAALGEHYDIRRTESVGPKIGAELMRTGIISVVLTMLGIAAYVWFRYEWQFAVGALVALTHDVLTTAGFFVITQLEFNLTALAALLTIAGYSVNDTVVVFDRVRENMRRYKKMSLVDMLNVSVNETMSRTIMTSGTVFFAMVALAAFGGPVLHSFSYSMLWGVIVGTYSSIWIANASLVYLNLRPERLRPDDDDAKPNAKPARP
ncbi:MAG: protein translocase subunit SecF [Alphaproteobacteria bacterium]|nr:protein translocase subunit SecF [Alphaproteobacteria bacterium]